MNWYYLTIPAGLVVLVIEHGWRGALAGAGLLALLVLAVWAGGRRG